jgi:hypothetical protein
MAGLARMGACRAPSTLEKYGLTRNLVPRSRNDVALQTGRISNTDLNSKNADSATFPALPWRLAVL